MPAHLQRGTAEGNHQPVLAVWQRPVWQSSWLAVSQSSTAAYGCLTLHDEWTKSSFLINPSVVIQHRLYTAFFVPGREESGTDSNSTTTPLPDHGTPASFSCLAEDRNSRFQWVGEDIFRFAEGTRRLWGVAGLVLLNQVTEVPLFLAWLARWRCATRVTTACGKRGRLQGVEEAPPGQATLASVRMRRLDFCQFLSAYDLVPIARLVAK
ncbi:hypothetical protein B0T26DRAFT_239976 [Lasiosphaeria miniovina]|uniref:Uncharacterized protein n=1 Tax=Lasiosphaeria miniovina TaxID=1954250 RepID=A0AA40AVV5_9PEZI|nr:uncharacterized protein B0T26DRAFT_239976 [Lasiosphaeria miniovina]KAK0722906.1 hypothetical protein B0T26DRAFT_239976 [Lasiosphaeria miniovina]